MRRSGIGKTRRRSRSLPAVIDVRSRVALGLMARVRTVAGSRHGRHRPCGSTLYYTPVASIVLAAGFIVRANAATPTITRPADSHAKLMPFAIII